MDIYIWFRAFPAWDHRSCYIPEPHSIGTMKYTARHIRRFLESGKIDATLWKNHFPTLLPSTVPACGDCSEFRDRTCAGERDPVECFLAKTGETDTGRAWKERDPHLGLGSSRSTGHASIKSFDQSKM
jgi:hypothetical protein